MKIFKLSELLPQIPGLLLRGKFSFEFKVLPYRAENIRLSKKRSVRTGGEIWIVE